MDRAAAARQIMAYFDSQWTISHPDVEVVYPNITTKQTPNPADPDSAWLRVAIMDIDGPNQTTFGGTLTSRSHILFQAYTPLDAGSGLGDELVDAAIQLVRGVTTGKVQFLPMSETFLGYEDETDLWWMSMGRVPFWIPDDDPAGDEMFITAVSATLHGLAYNTTTDATATELFLDGVSQQMTIESGVAAGFVSHIIGIDAAGEIAHWRLVGTVKCIAGTVSIDGPVIVDPIGETDPAWGEPTATASNAPDAFVLTVIGKAGTTIRWSSSTTFFRSAI